MEEKLEVIKRLDKIETMQKVADDYGVERITGKETIENRKMVLLESYGECTKKSDKR